MHLCLNNKAKTFNSFIYMIKNNKKCVTLKAKSFYPPQNFKLLL